MSSERPDEALTAAERRLAVLLEPLRGESPLAPTELTAAVVRTARSQRAARGTLILLGDLVAAATAGTEILLGIERSSSAPAKRR